MFEKKVFISHSAKNKEIADYLCAFIARLGVNEKNISCSSVIGQGISNGDKLNTAIAKAISKSALLVFLISHDFINSTYCLEELGVGWYLAQKGRVTCYYLLIPDIEMSELIGFVNSKIDRISILDYNCQDELSLFSTDLGRKLGINQKAHPIVTNAENMFLSSIRASISSLLIEKQELLENELKAKQTVKKLEENLEELSSENQRQQIFIRFIESKNERRSLLLELDTIVNCFSLLGYGGGITQSEFDSFEREFWFKMVTRYIELLDLLGISPSNGHIEKLLATIFLADGNQAEAYIHLKNFVHLENRYTDLNSIKYFSDNYKDSMSEVIVMLEEYLKYQKEGICKYSLIEVLSYLIDRESKLRF